MDYFRLARDERIRDAVYPGELKKFIEHVPFHPPKLEVIWDEEVIPVNLKPGSQSRYTDFLEEPTPLVSGPFKEILAEYAPGMRVKQVVLLDLSGRPPRQESYWLILPERVDCLSDQTAFNVNGTLKQLVIDPAKLTGKCVVQVGGVMETLLIVRLDVAESLLRRELTGFKLERVRLAEG